MPERRHADIYGVDDMTGDRMNFFSRVLAICIVLLLVGGTPPEFTPPPNPPPAPVFGETVTGSATWYGPVFAGRVTTSGEEFNMEELTASHASLPFGTVVEVTNPENKKSVRVVINDRHNLDAGEYQLCISRKAAQLLGVYPRKRFNVSFMVIK
jgi:rare lipoprotein A